MFKDYIIYIEKSPGALGSVHHLALISGYKKKKKTKSGMTQTKPDLVL